MDQICGEVSTVTGGRVLSDIVMAGTGGSKLIEYDTETDHLSNRVPVAPTGTGEMGSGSEPMLSSAW
jgi:hypothetical protein